MLDKNVFFEGVENLLAFYPSWQVNVEDKKVLRLWYAKFSKMTDKEFKHMIDSYIKSERYSPTVAGLFEHDTLPRKSRDQIEHEKAMEEQKRLLKEELG